MKNLLFWIKEKRLSFYYSLFLWAAFELQLGVLRELGIQKFLLIAVITGFVLFAELGYGILFLRKRYTNYEIGQVILPMIRSHALHQIFLPIFLCVGASSFIFFYSDQIITHLMIMVVSVVYWLLFLNIRGVYDRDFELENFSHGVFNIAKVFAFFLLTSFALEFTHYYALPSYSVGMALFLVSFALLLLTIFRHMQYNRRALMIVWMLSFAIGILGAFWGRIVFTNYFNMSLYLTIIYYVISSFVHHKSEGSLDVVTVVEYAAISMLSVVILAG